MKIKILILIAYFLANFAFATEGSEDAESPLYHDTNGNYYKFFDFTVTQEHTYANALSSASMKTLEINGINYIGQLATFDSAASAQEIVDLDSLRQEYGRNWIGLSGFVDNSKSTENLRWIDDKTFDSSNYSIDYGNVDGPNIYAGLLLGKNVGNLIQLVDMASKAYGGYVVEYINAASIPETGTFGAILGTLAFCFIAYRKRK